MMKQHDMLRRPDIGLNQSTPGLNLGNDFNIGPTNQDSSWRETIDLPSSERLDRSLNRRSSHEVESILTKRLQREPVN